MQLPPRPRPRIEDERTPPEGMTGKRALQRLEATSDQQRQSIQSHDDYLGVVAKELGGFAEWREKLVRWCAQHDIADTARDARLDAFRKSLDDHTKAEIKRRPLTAAQVVGYGTAIAGVIAAVFGGASQLASSLTATARAQSAEVAVQKVEQVDSRRHEADVQAAAQRGFELGQQQMDAKWQQRRIEEAAKADAKAAPKRSKR